MSSHSFIPVLGTRLRATRTNQIGVPSSESNAQTVTDGFITVSLTSEVEDGVEILQRNAAGALCVNERRANSFKRFNLEVEFCGVPPELLTMITNAEPYEDHAGDIAGFTVPEGEIDRHFAFELWTGLSGSTDSEEAGGYLLLPLVTGGTIGDVTVDGENAINFTATGMMTKGGNRWGVGPYDVVRTEGTEGTEGAPGDPSPLPTALDPYDHLLMIDTALAAPPVTEGGAEAVPTSGGAG